jgi:phospholipid/cholesterol/gamma-HCH transport system ATP-binding protein
MNHHPPRPVVDHPPAVVARGITVRYGSKTILRNIDLTVPRGHIYAILGGSGSGKSTLLKALLDLLQVQAGTVTLLGQTRDASQAAIPLSVLQRIGVLFQDGALLGSLTVGDNIALPLREHRQLPPAVVAELVRDKLAQVELLHAEHLYPAALSGGMRKRAGLARALALDPEVLFCDEPSAGLDPQSSAAIDALLLSLRDRLQMTVVLVTHELASIAAIVDSVLLIGGGDVVAEGPLAEVQGRGLPLVDDFFARTAPSHRDRTHTAASLFGLTGPTGGPHG